MKLYATESYWNAGTKSRQSRRVEVTPEDAVSITVDFRARQYEGDLERMRERNDALAGVVGRLMTALIANGRLRAEQVTDIFGADIVAED
jgi:hypothetical protein